MKRGPLAISSGTILVKRGPIAYARSIDASVPGDAPESARLWKPGWNKTDKGDVKFTNRSAELVMKAWRARGNPLVWYFEHEDRVPLEQRGGCPMKGAASATGSTLSVRPTDAGPECWAEGIEWTPEARRQITAGERRQLSPYFAYDEDTREITEIINVSLCTEGATHFGTILASKAGREQVSNMDELLNQLLSAIEAKDWELCENLIQQLEAAEGGAIIAKVGRMAIKAAKEPAEEDKPKDDAEAMKKLAASLATLATSRPAGNANVLALTRELEAQRVATARAEAEARTATREAKIGRVEGIIAANRDCFDGVDEREHLQAADPERTRKHVESIKRKFAASGDGDGKTLLAAGRGEARPPKGGPKADDDTAGLTPTELATAAQHGVSAKDFAASKARAAKGRN